MKPFAPPSYSEKIDRLLTPLRLNDLGPGEPNAAVRGELESLCVNGVYAPGLFQNRLNKSVADRSMASACLSAMWLYHDFLDESHSLSQEISTVEGSYWHGIMHRREPDYGNAKYWIRRVGDHPIGPDLAQTARELALELGTDSASQFLVDESSWDSFKFIDLCQAAASGSSASAMLCRQIQQREWWLLFGYCFQYACSPHR